MEDIELHDAARVKTIIVKGGRYNASQSDVTRMATLSITPVNSNYVLNFHNDAYNMDTIFAKTEHWERNYLITNWTGEKENKYRGICFLTDKTLRIHGAAGAVSEVPKFFCIETAT